MELTADLLRKIWSVCWRIVVFLILWGGLYAPGMFLLADGLESASAAERAETRLYVELFGVLAIAVAAWLMLRFVDGRTFGSLGFRLRRAPRESAIGLLLGTAMVSLALVSLWLPGWVETIPLRGFSWRAIGLMAGAVLFNSAIQEVLCRGYFLQTVETRFDVTIALAASSAFFLLLHAGAVAEGGALAAINLFAAGWLLGLAYTATRNLWLPIGLHFSWNVLQGPVLGIAVSGQALDSGWQVLRLEGPVVLTGGDFGLEGGLVATAVTMMGIAFLVRLGRRADEPD